MKLYHVSAQKHRAFRAFGARAVLWRPRRRRYEPYRGAFEPTKVARFVQGVLGRGTALAHELKAAVAM